LSSLSFLVKDNGEDFGCLSIPGVYFAQDVSEKNNELKM